MFGAVSFSRSRTLRITLTWTFVPVELPALSVAFPCRAAVLPNVIIPPPVVISRPPFTPTVTHWADSPGIEAPSRCRCG